MTATPETIAVTTNAVMIRLFFGIQLFICLLALYQDLKRVSTRSEENLVGGVLLGSGCR